MQTLNNIHSPPPFYQSRSILYSPNIQTKTHTLSQTLEGDKCKHSREQIPLHKNVQKDFFHITSYFRYFRSYYMAVHSTWEVLNMSTKTEAGAEKPKKRLTVSTNHFTNTSLTVTVL